MKKTATRDTLEMLDGRIYFSTDNWASVWLNRGGANGKSHRKILDKHTINLVRYLVTYRDGSTRNENK